MSCALAFAPTSCATLLTGVQLGVSSVPDSPTERPRSRGRRCLSWDRVGQLVQEWLAGASIRSVLAGCGTGSRDAEAGPPASWDRLAEVRAALAETPCGDVVILRWSLVAELEWVEGAELHGAERALAAATRSRRRTGQTAARKRIDSAHQRRRVLQSEVARVSRTMDYLAGMEWLAGELRRRGVR